jgi:hypothetical protein
LQVSPAILAGAGGQYLATVKMGNMLRAIANTQYGQSAVELCKIKMRRVLLPNRIGTAGKDKALYAAVNFGKMIEWVDLAVNIELPDTARYELGKLRAKVKNKDFFLHGQR